MTPLERYLTYGLPRVDGWLEPYSAEIIGFLSETQRLSSIQGTVGEIGVHHGKLFLVLLLTMAPGERAFAIDIFEQQAFGKFQHDSVGRRAAALESGPHNRDEIRLMELTCADVD